MFGSNSLNSPTMETLASLKASKFEFHLTGSRFFNSATKESDYDFFTKNCPEIKKWLEDEGFTLRRYGGRD